VAVTSYQPPTFNDDGARDGPMGGPAGAMAPPQIWNKKKKSAMEKKNSILVPHKNKQTPGPPP
jgi:hypothetical protein